ADIEAPPDDRAALAATLASAPASAQTAPAEAAQGFVLVVEDTPANALVLSTFLQKLGVRSVVVGNGREAVDLIASGPRPQMVLMDCQMPVMDGFEATNRIRALEKELAAPRLPVVALTASAFGEDRARCIAAGMDDFLAKPLLFKQVQALIGKWMPAK
ncbi:MAG: response regulator, partial [Betaproteobacteria bacterium]